MQLGLLVEYSPDLAAAQFQRRVWLWVCCIILWSVGASVLADVTVDSNDPNSARSTFNASRCPTSGDPHRAKYFEVCDAESRLDDGVLLLQAKFYFGLSEAVEEALKSGVPITLQVRIEILRERNFIWDETIAGLTQKYRIQYHNLSQQYILSNLNTKLNSIFQTSQSAINLISHIHGFPIIDKKLLDDKETYYGRIRISLVLRDLPSPLRLWAYLSSDWRLKSEWFQWQL